VNHAISSKLADSFFDSFFYASQVVLGGKGICLLFQSPAMDCVHCQIRGDTTMTNTTQRTISNQVEGQSKVDERLR
jgi:hypothetical protein